MNRIQYLCLGLIAAGAFHINSTLLFAILGIVPSDPDSWPLALILVGLWLLCSVPLVLQRLIASPRLSRSLGGVSGMAGGSIWGLFIAVQLGQQQLAWAVSGLVIGAIAGVLWSFCGGGGQQPNSFGERAIALNSGLCAYALAFYLFTWQLNAMAGGRYSIFAGLFLPTAFFLWSAWKLIFDRHRHLY